MICDNIINGDALEQLKLLPDNSVDCCVTSPPYWALRDYGVSGQLGLEETFQEYINKLCNIFDEVKRVLKKEGCIFVNIGDTYMGNSSYSEKGRQGFGNDKIGMINKKWLNPKNPIDSKLIAREHVAKGQILDKSLCQIPSRFAIEMCSRGWILRNEIIWHKPNCMPSSASDRFTVDFEKVFFFVKQKKYFFNTQYEKVVAHSDSWYRNKLRQNKNYQMKPPYQHNFPIPKFTDKKIKRATFSVNTKPFKGSHFATFPEKLIEPMISAGCPENGVVLDPFFGAGTTALVAIKQNKNYIGIELNKEYIKIAQDRINELNGMFI